MKIVFVCDVLFPCYSSFFPPQWLLFHISKSIHRIWTSHHLSLGLKYFISFTWKGIRQSTDAAISSVQYVPLNLFCISSSTCLVGLLCYQPQQYLPRQHLTNNELLDDDDVMIIFTKCSPVWPIRRQPEYHKSKAGKEHTGESENVAGEGKLSPHLYLEGKNSIAGGVIDGGHDLSIRHCPCDIPLTGLLGNTKHKTWISNLPQTDKHTNAQRNNPREYENLT